MPLKTMWPQRDFIFKEEEFLATDCGHLHTRTSESPKETRPRGGQRASACSGDATPVPKRESRREHLKVKFSDANGGAGGQTPTTNHAPSAAAKYARAVLEAAKTCPGCSSLEEEPIENILTYYDSLVAHWANCPQVGWVLSNKARNKEMHALNGNRPPFPRPPHPAPPRPVKPKAKAKGSGQAAKKSAKKRPEAKFTQTRNADPRGAKGVTVTHTSLYANVETPAVVNAFEAHEMQFNPGLAHVVPYFFGLATSFTNYEILNCRFDYVTEVAEQDGLVRMAVSYKNDEPKPLTDLAFSEVAGSVKTAPWENARITANPRQIHNIAKMLKTRTSHEDNLDGYDGLKFWWSLSHCPIASKHLGHIYVTCTIRFFNSRLASDTGSLTSGDSAAFCGTVSTPAVAAPGGNCYSLIDTTDHNGIAGLVKHLETSGANAGASYFTVNRAMKVEVTLSSSIANTNTTITPAQIPYLRVSPRFGYCAESDPVGAGTTLITASATDSAGVGPAADGAGLVAINSVSYPHHVKAIVHLSPGYKYFYYFYNYASSDIDAVFDSVSRVLHVAFRFLGMLEHVASFIALDEMENLERLRGPIHAPTDHQTNRSIRKRIEEKLSTGWEPTSYLQRYLESKAGMLATISEGGGEVQLPASPSEKKDVPDTEPPRTKTYKDLVKEYNKLQTQLDAIELVKIERGELDGVARNPLSLN